ncbi:uncharacterized protein LOC133734538 [Rosa rugosa]|uniref:uncharacterized protein LOC133734538 n=1 Tax=Rosa rugosa TaxID=74645 RepID=UPI002B407695|nr:uncharacterized protein LOC133734538 [Rosa rugosa]
MEKRMERKKLRAVSPISRGKNNCTHDERRLKTTWEVIRVDMNSRLLRLQGSFGLRYLYTQPKDFTIGCLNSLDSTKKLSELDQQNKDQEDKFLNYIQGVY